MHGVAVADLRDIACMKVTAIAGRGTKRDFVDLYVAARQLGGLKAVLDWFSQKYAAANYSRPHILKSLTFFSDAEQEPTPDMLVPCDWEAVKRYFIMEAPRLL
ncbi:MAG: nucleotidyl transferase AbiEii/AbiGii toxin family protein [Gemmataceae bacterium]